MQDPETLPGALELVPPMQSLEDGEQRGCVFHGEADSLVVDGVTAVIPFRRTMHRDQRRGPRAGELDGVGQQVRPHLTDLADIADSGGERGEAEAEFPLRVPLGSHRVQICRPAPTPEGLDARSIGSGPPDDKLLLLVGGHSHNRVSGKPGAVQARLARQYPAGYTY